MCNLAGRILLRRYPLKILDKLAKFSYLLILALLLYVHYLPDQEQHINFTVLSLACLLI